MSLNYMPAKMPCLQSLDNIGQQIMYSEGGGGVNMGSANQMIRGAVSTSDNYLVVELLRIIQGLPSGLGWLGWVLRLIHHCIMMIFVNILIKHFTLNTIYWLLDYFKFKCLTLLPFLGYKTFVFKLPNWQMHPMNGRIELGSAIPKGNEEIRLYQKVAQFYGVTNHNLNELITPQKVPRVLSRTLSDKEIIELLDVDKIKDSDTLNAGVNAANQITEANNSWSWNQCNPFQLSSNYVSLTTHPSAEHSFCLYFNDERVLQIIKKFQIPNDYELPYELRDRACFYNIDFDNNKTGTTNTVESNPLIPIKNYRKLAQLIGEYTKTQQCLGYKNITPISIDGEPGLGKTSFMDYFSHNHNKDYKIIYLNMIKNFKVPFQAIYETILSSIKNHTHDLNNPMGQSKGLVFMIDEVDKYVDMHLEYLENRAKHALDDSDDEEDIGVEGMYASHQYNPIDPIIGLTKKHLPLQWDETVLDENGDWGSSLDQSNGLPSGLPARLPFGPGRGGGRDRSGHGRGGHGRGGVGGDRSGRGRGGAIGRDRDDVNQDKRTHGKISTSSSQNRANSRKYFKKEILYHLMDLLNQKVGNPTYLIFCTNNFDSLWDDLDERHSHLAALKNRFIQMHFERLDKENITEILKHINGLFIKNLPEKALSKENLEELTELIPPDQRVTVRKLHHLLIGCMYDLEQFVQGLPNPES